MTALIAFAGTLLVRATVLLAGALLVGALLGRGSAAARHAFWSVTAVALLLLPWLPSALPHLAVPLPAVALSWTDRATRGAHVATADVLLVQAPAVEPTEAPAALLATPSRSTVLPSVPTDVPRVARGGWLHTDLPTRGALLAMWLWAVGSLAAIGSLLIALRRVARVARSGTLLTDRSWQGSLARSRVRVGVRRPVALRSTPAASTALAGGVVRAFVLVPSSAAAWSTERRELVLLHELVHVARHDALRQIVSRLAVALYWFHPLARLAARKALLAREEACDEAVIALGLKPSVYARHLLDLAETGELMLPALSLTERPQLEKRVMSILRDRPRSGRRATLAAAACAGLWALTVAATAPASSSQQVPPTPTPPRAAPLPSRAPVAVAPSAPSAPSVQVAPSVAPGVARTAPAAPRPAVVMPQAPAAPLPSVAGEPTFPNAPAVAPAPTSPPARQPGSAPSAPTSPPSRQSPPSTPAAALPSVAPGTPAAVTPGVARPLAPARVSPAVPAVPDAALPWTVPTPILRFPFVSAVPQERSCWEVPAGQTAESRRIRSRSDGSGELERFVVSGGDRMIRSTSGDMTVCMRAHGPVSFATDGTRIGSLDAGSWVVIGSRDAQRTVEMVVTQGASGLSYLWYVNGTLTPMGSEGTAWRDAVVPVVASLWETVDLTSGSELAAREAMLRASREVRALDEAERAQLRAAADQMRGIERRATLMQRDTARQLADRRSTQAAAEVERLSRELEALAGRQSASVRSPQTDTLRALLQQQVAVQEAARLAIETESLARAQRLETVVLEREREARAAQLDASQRRVRDRTETMRELEERLAQLPSETGANDRQLQDLLRRLQEAMRRIP